MTWKGVLIIFLIAMLIGYAFNLDTSLEPVKKHVLNSQAVIDVVGKVEDADITRTVYGAFKKNSKYHVNRYYLNVKGAKGKAYIAAYVEYDPYKGIRHNSIVNIGIDEIRKK